MLQRIAFAASLVNILMLVDWAQFLFTGSRPNILAIWTVFILVTLCFERLLWLAERTQYRQLREAVFFLLFFAFGIGLLHIREVTYLASSYPFFSYTYFLGNWGSWNPLKFSLVACLLMAGYYRWRQLLQRGLVVGVALFCPSVLFTLGVATFESFRPIGFDRLTGSTRGSPLVWLVFDELDYNYLYDWRPKDRSYPEFDHFREASLYLERSQSPSESTMVSVSSYLLGRRPKELDLSRGPASCYTDQEGQTVQWSEADTLFKRLHNEGFQIAVIGWALPYCRLFGSQIDYCGPYPRSRWPYEKEYWSTVKTFATHLFRKEFDVRKKHAALVRSFSREAEELVQKSWDLALLHWPIPHYPGITPLNPSLTEDQQVIADYFDNIALADRALSRMRSILEQRGIWKEATVIVTSDHYWRFVPKDLKEIHPQGGSVPFMVKFPNQNSSMKVAGNFDSILVNKFIPEVLHRRISNPEQAKAWFLREKYQ